MPVTHWELTQATPQESMPVTHWESMQATSSPALLTASTA
jgi:hypothetical protein